MNTFKDANGMDWAFDIKFKSVEAVKRHCKDREGKPLDLLALIESGKLEQLENNVELIVNVVFVLCYAQVRERFNLAAYEESMQAEYEMFPELKEESEMFKAGRWFGGLLDGHALESMTNALLESLINFCPNGSRRAALKKIGEKSKELEQIRCEAALQEIDAAMTEALPMMRAEMKKQMQESLSNALSGSVQESPELIPLRFPSGS